MPIYIGGWFLIGTGFTLGFSHSLNVFDFTLKTTS